MPRASRAPSAGTAIEREPGRQHVAQHRQRLEHRPRARDAGRGAVDDDLLAEREPARDQDDGGERLHEHAAPQHHDDGRRGEQQGDAEEGVLLGAVHRQRGRGPRVGADAAGGAPPQLGEVVARRWVEDVAVALRPGELPPQRHRDDREADPCGRAEAGQHPPQAAAARARGRRRRRRPGRRRSAAAPPRRSGPATRRAGPAPRRHAPGGGPAARRSTRSTMSGHEELRHEVRVPVGVRDHARARSRRSPHRWRRRAGARPGAAGTARTTRMP